MWNRFPPVLVVTLLCGVAATAALAQRAPDPLTAQVAASVDIAESARRFLSALTPAQRTRAVFAFATDERSRWDHAAKPRPGLALKDLSDAQRALAYGLLSTALSRRGFAKATGIMALEEVLRRRDTSLAHDPGAYTVSVFGEPSTAVTWGFRVEGHHLSLNLTFVDGIRPVVGPAFFGASPAPGGSSVLADARVLGREQDLGLRLLASLDEAQRKAAVYRATAPDDILTGPGAGLAALPGLTAAQMTPLQRQGLDALLDEIVGNLPREVAERERARIATHAPADLVFTWAGGASLGQPHYYRVSGPSFVYELDSTQPNADHVHTVWHARDQAGGDFAADLLRQREAEAHAVAETADSKQTRAELVHPIEPFKIAGNIYYVGATNIASYLIASSRGLILLDTGTREMLPMVQSSIVKLGFQLQDVKIILTSHAHWDHVEGHAAMKRATGAQVMAIAEEVPALSSGKDLSAVGDLGWEPVVVDRVLHDGDDVVLGEVTMHALLTAGHTQGCTTWTTTAKDSARSYAVVFICVPQAAGGVKLLGSKQQPTMAADLARSLRVLKALTPDIYLDGHPEEIYAGKLARLRAGEVPNPLVDRAGYAKYLADCEADYRRRLQQERRKPWPTTGGYR